MIKWNFYIDFDYTGSGSPNFTTSYDDITSYIKEISVRIGSTDHKSRVASIGNCKLTLDNTSKVFSPDNEDSIYYTKLRPGLPVKLTITLDDNSVITRFLGYLENIEPDSGSYGDRECDLACSDYLQILQTYNVSLPYFEDTTGDVLVKHLVNSAFFSSQAYNTLNYLQNVVANDNAVLTATDGTFTYTYKSTPATINEIKVGASRYESIDNLKHALNGEAGSGTEYYAGTTRTRYIRADYNESFYQLVHEHAIRYYRCDETSGVVCADSGVNLRNAEYKNGVILGSSPILTGDNGSAVTLDGANDYILAPSISIKDRSYSLECWFHISTTSTACAFISLYKSNTNREYVYLGVNSSNKLVFTNGASTFTGTTTISRFSDYMVTATYDYVNDTAYIYLNGVLEGSITSFGSINVDETIFYIGTKESTTLFYTGDICNVCLFFEVLNPTLLELHYASRLITPGLTLLSVILGDSSNDFTLDSNSIYLTALSAFPSAFENGSDSPDSFSYDTSLHTYNVTPEWNNDSTNSLTAITDLAVGEYGEFYQKANGSLVFRNRDSDFIDASNTPALVLNSEPELKLQQDKGNIFNIINVKYLPPAIVEQDTLGVIRNPIALVGKWGNQRPIFDHHNPPHDKHGHYGYTNPNGGITQIKVDYQDQTNRRKISAKSIDLPLVGTTNYILAEDTDGTLQDYYTNQSNWVKFVVDNKGSYADIYCTNTALGILQLTFLSLTGIAIKRFDPVTVSRVDSVSQTYYKVRNTHSYNINVPVSSQFAVALAEYLLSLYGNASSLITKMDFNAQQYINGVDLHTLDIGDIIDLSDAQTTISNGIYKIIGMSFKFSPGDGSKSSKPKTDLSVSVRRLNVLNYGVYDSDLTLYDESYYTL